MTQVQLMTKGQLMTQARWYKQFWPWFLIALPSAAVIASFISLDIAIKHADTPVHGDYVQHGLTVLHKNPAHETQLQQPSTETGDAQPQQ